MNIPIIFEDQFLLVIDKPSGMVVNRALNVKKMTVQDWAAEKLNIKKSKLNINDKDFFDRSGVVHRLDKETSGLLIMAKSAASFKNIQQQFFQRKVEKKYQALVHGRLLTGSGVIKVPVGRLPWNRRKFGVLAQGRISQTKYQSVAYYRNNDKEIFTLVDACPVTGRTHQIRIHFKYLGFSIVSDVLYSGRKTYRKDINFCPRLFLHAKNLRFLHPRSDKSLFLVSPLPVDLSAVLNKLKKI